MTVGELRRALSAVNDQARVVVWLPGSRIDLFGVMHVSRGDLLIEGGVREGSALDPSYPHAPK